MWNFVMTVGRKITHSRIKKTNIGPRSAIRYSNTSRQQTSLVFFALVESYGAFCYTTDCSANHFVLAFLMYTRVELVAPTNAKKMENRPVRFRLRMPGPSSPRQRQKLRVGRGRASTGPSRSSEKPDGRRSASVPVKFVSNPKHPKNLYAADMSMRQIIKDKPVKVSSDMAFPDPKSGKSIRNPTAPRFRHEFDPSEKDYDIITNPLAGAEGAHALIPNTDDDNNNFIYVDDSDDSGSDDSYDSATRFSIIDDDTEIDASEINSTLERMQDEESTAFYSEGHTKKNRGHFVRERPSLLENGAPEFAPQPPPPRGLSAVLVIPRAVVREDDAHRNRVRGSAQNGERTYLNIGP